MLSEVGDQGSCLAEVGDCCEGDGNGQECEEGGEREKEDKRKIT